MKEDQLHDDVPGQLDLTDSTLAKTKAPKIVRSKGPLNLGAEGVESPVVAEPDAVDTAPESADRVAELEAQLASVIHMLENRPGQLAPEPRTEQSAVDASLPSALEDVLTHQNPRTEDVSEPTPSGQSRPRVVNVEEELGLKRQQPRVGALRQDPKQSTKGGPSRLATSSKARPRKESRMWWLLPVVTFVASFFLFQSVATGSPVVSANYPVPATTGLAEVPVCSTGSTVVWYEPSTKSHVLATLPATTGDRYVWTVPGSQTGTLTMSHAQLKGLPSCQ